MLKVMGCIMILGSCILLGVEKGNRVSRQREELEELYKLFMLFRVEMETLKLPFHELCMSIQRKMNSHRKDWLIELAHRSDYSEEENFMDFWCAAVDSHFLPEQLPLAEREELKHLGKNISSPESIKMYCSHLEMEIQSKREEEKEKKKLYQSMGVMAGCFLVILLL